MEQTSARGSNHFGSFKILLNRFHYEEMLPRYRSIRLKFVNKDTDFSLRFKTRKLYADMSTFKHLDLSVYPEDHIVHGKTNKKVQLTMTDEQNGKDLKEVVRLFSKLKSNDYLGGTKRSAKSQEKPVKIFEESI